MDTAADVYRAYVDAEARRDDDGMVARLAPDVVIELDGKLALGSADEDAAAMTALFDAYPDYRRELIEVIGEGSRADHARHGRHQPRRLDHHRRPALVGHPRPELADRSPQLDIRGCSFVVVVGGRMTEAYVWSPEGALEEVLSLVS